jgi:hypothetical protein
LAEKSSHNGARPAMEAVDGPQRVAALQERFPETPMDASRLRRFLRARNGDIEAAAALLKGDIEWRTSQPVPPPPSTFAARLPLKKAYFHGTDKAGMPLIVVFPGRHRGSEPVEENLALAIYMFELAIHSMAPGVERIMIIIDFEGFGMQCLDYPFLKQAIHVLQNYYPERLGRVCLLDPPWMFRAVWAVVKPWLDERTRDKVQFMSGDYKKQLQAFVEPANVPAKYGGTSTFTYDPDSAQPYGLVPPMPLDPSVATPTPTPVLAPNPSPTPGPASAVALPSTATPESAASPAPSEANPPAPTPADALPTPPSEAQEANTQMP